MKQKITVRAIVKKDQKVLLVKPKDSEVFVLPGATLQPGDEPKATLERSLQAELGHGTQVMQLFDVISSINPHQDEQELSILFLVGLEGQSSIELANDLRRYSWVKLSDAQHGLLDTVAQNALMPVEQTNIQEVEQQAKRVNVDRTTTQSIANREVIAYSDGGSRGNPGPSAAGFVILNTSEEVLYEGGKYLGITTNNQAEYQAVKLALEKALELGARVVKFNMDSLLIVNQMSGLYQVKNRDLWPIYANIKELVKRFDHVSFLHVRREFNKEADRLVNKVLDDQVK